MSSRVRGAVASMLKTNYLFVRNYILFFGEHNLKIKSLFNLKCTNYSRIKQGFIFKVQFEKRVVFFNFFGKKNIEKIKF